MTRSFPCLVAAAALACAGSLFAQSAAPDIPYDAVADLLKLPDNIHLGEAAGVATNSKGHIFVYTRTGAAHATLGTSRTFYKAGSRLFEFDQAGKFVKEIGQGVYGINFAQQVRIDPQDNIWVVDAGSNQVIKFSADGKVAAVMGRKPEAINVRPGPGTSPITMGPFGGTIPAAGRGGAPEGRGAGGAPAAEGRGGAGGAEGRGGAAGAAPAGGGPAAPPPGV